MTSSGPLPPPSCPSRGPPRSHTPLHARCPPWRRRRVMGRLSELGYTDPTPDTPAPKQPARVTEGPPGRWEGRCLHAALGRHGSPAGPDHTPPHPRPLRTCGQTHAAPDGLRSRASSFHSARRFLLDVTTCRPACEAVPWACCSAVTSGGTRADAHPAAPRALAWQHEHIRLPPPQAAGPGGWRPPVATPSRSVGQPPQRRR